ncbi:SufS family cysteine desulfurase [Colwellia ponticola]|uniref:cysteine desulfurase n=1 Tax=Colwellia ponticola TaxID=2304625 RepID=A0A8H2PMC2_9GAMM|nr:SufS family cysteine desulfurase [Colwellia ponticola]TMM46297.1 SufS family cysteine desulfurase [Colwellia ponticola]
MNIFEPHLFRQQFPLIIQHEKAQIDQHSLNPALVYLDNAATTQKPEQVINSYQYYYQNSNANVHRASHQLSSKATSAFEQARSSVQKFIGARSIKEIIWTKGATESINIIAQALARNTLRLGDEIVLCASEHHANIVPWQIVAQQTGAVIKVLTLNNQGYIDVDSIDNVITSKTKIVACAHISNVLGRINPIKSVIERAKHVGAISVIDGAQAVAHLSVNVAALDCDFYVFSAHKMYGPTGVGVLYGKEALLESMSPYQGGGEMIKTVSFTQATTFNALPFKFEAGTPNIAGVIAFSQCIDFLAPLLADKKQGYSLYEQQLLQYCYQGLSQIKPVKFIAEGMPDIGVIAFTLTGHHNHDVAMALDSYGIAIRSGHHCAMPLMTYLQLDGCLRISIAAYNTVAEIDYLLNCLHSILQEEGGDNSVLVKQGKAESQVSLSSSQLIQSAKPAVQTMDDIIRLFTKTKGWDSRHREIMLLGKKLPRLDKSLRNDNTLIAGCESLAWLQVEKNIDGSYIFTADSDAKIIRGLLVIVLAAFNGRNAQEINQVNINEYFNTLGLLQHLSPSRGNGLLAIVDKIKLLAQ